MSTPWSVHLITVSQVDVRSVATHFGATYDTIENRLRPVKRQATELQKAVDSGSQGQVASTRKSPSKPKTPRKSATALESKSPSDLAYVLTTR